MRKKLTKLAGIILFAVSASSTSAATLITTGDKLTGATGVNVGGTLYDVAFLDGSCTAVFSGCDSSSDFAFTSLASVQLAGKALLDQVLIGVFASQPGLTNGCTSTTCIIETPYGVSGNNVLLFDVYNQPGVQPDEFSNFTIDRSFNTTPYNYVTYARFTPTAVIAAIPEPSSWAMMLFGFGAVGFAMRRRKWAERSLQSA